MVVHDVKGEERAEVFNSGRTGERLTAAGMANGTWGDGGARRAGRRALPGGE